MRRTKAAAALILALASAAPVAVLAQDKQVMVKIQDYPGIGNMLFRIAASKGYCAKHGLKCELPIIPTGPLGVQGLLAKNIDVAFIGPEVQINAMLKGSKLKAISSAASLNVFQIVIRNGLEAPNADKGYPAFMADLKGKKIGVVARGASAELQFGLLAQKAGLTPDDFTFVAVGSPNTSYGALTSGQIDASMTFEPSGSMCDVLKTCKTIYRAFQAPEPKEIKNTNGASANLVVTLETIEKTPQVVDALIAAAKDAEAFIQDPNNFDETLKIAQSFFKFDFPRGDEVMSAALKTYIPGYKVEIDRAALKQIADNMLATKQIEAPFDTSVIPYDKAP
jgi:NitT/TauT family transport system substrate-binding protein